MDTNKSIYRLVYLPVNQCWQSVFGDAPSAINWVSLGSLADYRAACDACGLQMTLMQCGEYAISIKPQSA
jgi:hypothetical protein